MQFGKIKRGCFKCGQTIWWIALVSCQIIGIGCIIKAGIIFDDEFNETCIKNTNIEIQKPPTEEFSALLWLSVIGIIAFCCGSCMAFFLLMMNEHCCCNGKVAAEQIMTIISIFDAIGFSVIFLHIYIYLSVLGNELIDPSNLIEKCITNEQFNSAINWSKAGLIVSCTIIFILGCNGYLLWHRHRTMRYYTKPTEQHEIHDIEAQNKDDVWLKVSSLLSDMEYENKDNVIIQLKNLANENLYSLRPDVDWEYNALGPYHPIETATLKLTGALPIQYKSNQWKIPIIMWIPKDFPSNPPICRVVCTEGMKFGAQHQNVDDKGLVYYHPYLNLWKQQKQGSLAEFLAEICCTFNEK
eukprot:93033_1